MVTGVLQRGGTMAEQKFVLLQRFLLRLDGCKTPGSDDENKEDDL